MGGLLIRGILIGVLFGVPVGAVQDFFGDVCQRTGLDGAGRAVLSDETGEEAPQSRFF